MFIITHRNNAFVFTGYDEFGDPTWVRPEYRTWAPVVFTHREDAEHVWAKLPDGLREDTEIAAIITPFGYLTWL